MFKITDGYFLDLFKTHNHTEPILSLQSMMNEL